MQNPGTDYKVPPGGEIMTFRVGSPIHNSILRSAGGDSLSDPKHRANDTPPAHSPCRLVLALVSGKEAKILHTLTTGDDIECRVEADNLMTQLKIERENANVHPVFRSILKTFSDPVYPGGGR